MKTIPIFLLLLVSTFAPVRGDDSDLPWKVNQPLVTVQKEVYKKHPRKGAGVLVSVRYVGPKLERRETHSVEFRDDVYSERFSRFSSDNGKTWSPSRPLAATDVYYKGKELSESGGAEFYDRKTGLLVGVWLRQIAINRSYNNFTYSRFSQDFGQTWSKPGQLRYEAGIDFNPDDPHNALFLKSNQTYFGNNIIRHSNGTLIHVVAHANAPGDEDNARRSWRMGSVVFIGRWKVDESDYEWTPGARVEISPLHSARGLMEPEVAELKDGPQLIV